MAQEKFVLCVQAAVQHQFNIIIARGPRVFKIFPSAGIKIFGHLISDKIQRFAQRGAPFLVPARVPAGITAAVGPPAFHPVETAPGRIFKNLCFILRRELLQKFAVHRQMHVRQALHIFKAVSQGHIGKFLVVAVCFAVGGNMHQLRFGAAGIGAHQAAGKIFAAFKRIRKSNPLRDGPVIKKQSDFFSGRQITQIRALRVHFCAGGVRPVFLPYFTHARTLPRGQNNVFHAVRGQYFQRGRVAGGFGQPHGFRLAPETRLKIGQPPFDLGFFVAGIGQRHNHMVVHLRNGRAVPAKIFHALFVRFQHRAVHLRRMRLHPGQQSRPEVKADMGVIVH